MPDLATLQAQLDALRKRRNSGIRGLAHGSRRTDFKSDQEMQAAERDLIRQIEALNGGARTTFATYSGD